MGRLKTELKGCLIILAIFGVFAIIGLIMRIAEQTTERSNPPKPEQNQKRITRPTQTPQISTQPTQKIYSPADAFVGINLSDTISVKGTIGNVRETEQGEVHFTLSAQGKGILCVAQSHKKYYTNGNLITITGQYYTTKVVELLLGTKISDTNVPVVWIPDP